ncbi:MAG TPA: mycofactocin biosynthesis chaperone MftB [Acidimicrobiales bacterium]|nr:mycofactocin biosynthesis chaperone MftB [Acidimicrobiales bacterium]
MSTSATGVDAVTATGVDAVLDRAWGLAPQVAVRREAFGGLLYHFGTRRLSFLKDPRLLSIVERLDDAPSARAACAVAGLDDAALPAYGRALARLADTDMLRERSR